jgi:hypothetical protein
LVYPLEGNPYSPVGQGDDLGNLQTEALVVTSDAVVSSALSSDDFSGVEASDVIENTSVTIPTNTQTLEIAYENSDSKFTGALTQALGDAYLQYRLDQRDEVVNEALEATQRRIDLATKQFRKAVTAAEDGENPQVNNGLADSLTAELVALRAQQVDTSAASRIPGDVINNPVVSPSSGLLPPAVMLIAGGLLGLILGTLAAVGLESRKTARTRSKSDHSAATPATEPSDRLTDDEAIGDFQWTEYTSRTDGR